MIHKMIDGFFNCIKMVKCQSKLLYHYTEQDAKISDEGLLSPYGLWNSGHKEWKNTKNRYEARACDELKKDPKELKDKDILEYLERSRGVGGSKMISFLVEPIPINLANDELAGFAQNSNLYAFDYDMAVNDKIVEAAFIVEERPKSQRKVPLNSLYDELFDVRPQNWKKKSKLLFAGRPHAFIVCKNGRIPPKYLKRIG